MGDCLILLRQTVLVSMFEIQLLHKLYSLQVTEKLFFLQFSIS